MSVYLYGNGSNPSSPTPQTHTLILGGGGDDDDDDMTLSNSISNNNNNNNNSYSAYGNNNNNNNNNYSAYGNNNNNNLISILYRAGSQGQTGWRVSSDDDQRYAYNPSSTVLGSGNYRSHQTQFTPIQVDRSRYHKIIQTLAIAAIVVLGSALLVISFAPLGLTAALSTTIIAGIAGALSVTMLAIFIETILTPGTTPKTLQKPSITPNAPSTEPSLFYRVPRAIAGGFVWVSSFFTDRFTNSVSTTAAPAAAAHTHKNESHADHILKFATSKSRWEVATKIALVILALAGAALVATAVLGLIPFVATPMLVNVAVFVGSGIAACALWYLTRGIVRNRVDNQFSLEQLKAKEFAIAGSGGTYDASQV